MVQKFQQSLIRYFTFLVGASQLILCIESQFYWVSLQLINDLQLISLLFIFNPKNSQGYSLIVEATVPTSLIIEDVVNHVVALSTMIMCILLLHVITLALIINSHYKQREQKHKQSDILIDSVSAKFEKINQNYGRTDYLDIWFQLANKSQAASLIVTKLVIHIFNSYLNVINRPILFYSLYVIMNSQQNTEISLACILLLLNTINYIICFTLFTNTMTVRGSNCLRMRTSLLYFIGQVIEHTTIIQVVVDHVDNQITIALLALVFIINVGELFYSIPYVEQYKRFTVIMSHSVCLLIVLTTIGDQNHEQASYFFIIVPLLIRVLTQISSQQNNQMLQDYVFQDIYNMTKLNVELLNDKGYQLKNTSSQKNNIQFVCLPHLLRLLNHAKLQQNSFYKLEQVDPIRINPLTSKLLQTISTLFYKHAAQCSKIYCYCKGLKGEPAKCVQQSISIRNLQQNSDITSTNVTIQADLINRQVRNQCKLIYHHCKNMPGYDFWFLIQLVMSLAESDECLQSISIIMDLIIANSELDDQPNNRQSKQQQLSIVHNIIAGVAIQFVKYNILLRYNSSINITELGTTLNYSYYRNVYNKSLNLFNKFVTCIKAKQQFLTSLDYQQTYESMEVQIRRLTTINHRVQQKLRQFMNSTKGKTALLCNMIFEFEILNCYVNTEKILSQIKSVEHKFFEFPDIYYEIEENSVEVCYLKVDLGTSMRDAQNGATRGWIRDYSRNAPRYFQYSPVNFGKLNNITSLMPYSTQKIHDDFIDIFLKTSRPNLLRVPLLLFIKTYNDELIHTELFADFDFQFQDGQFTMYTFLKKAKNSSGGQRNYFWVDQQGRLEGVSQNIFGNFQIVDPDSEWLYSQEFTTIMPAFENARQLLDNKLYDQLNQDDQSNGCGIQKYSHTFESLQLIHKERIVETSLCFPRGIMLNGRDTTFIVDCTIELKYAQLIGRIYKVYTIQIDNYQLNQNEISIHIDRFTDIELDIPREIDSEDHLFLGVLDQEIQFSSPDKSYQSSEQYQESQNKEASDIQVEQQIIYQQQQSIQYQDIYEPFQKDNLSSMRQGINMSLKQQLYFSEHLINNNTNTFNKSISIPQEQNRMTFQTKKVQEIVNKENESQPSSATSSSQQRILSKSSMYVQFADSPINPPSVMQITILNILMFITLVVLIIVSLIILQQLNYHFYNETHLLRSTLSTDYVLNVGQYIRHSEISFKNETQENIGLIMDKLGDILSQEQIDYYDLIDNQTRPVNLWTFFFTLQYYYGQMDNPDLYNETVTFFLQNYKNYDTWIDGTNGEVFKGIEDSIILLSSTINICMIVNLSVYFVYIILLILCIHQYVQLIKKVVRCCQQISYQAIVADLQYYDNLLQLFIQKKDKNRCYFNIYQHNCDFQDKLNIMINTERQNSKGSESTQQRYQLIQKLNQLGNRKTLSLKQQFSLKSYVAIPWNLICSTIFIILYLGVMFDLLAFKQLLEHEFKMFNEIVELQEKFLEVIYSNNIISGPFQSVLGEEAFDSYYEFFAESWEEYNELMNIIIYQDSQLSSVFTESLNKPLCQFSECNRTETLEVALTGLLKHMSESAHQGYLFSDEEMITITLTQKNFNAILDNLENWLKQSTQGQFDFQLLLLTALGGIILFFQLLQTVATHYSLINRFRQLKQFVYIMPAFTLYGEESFYKTLHYISFKEQELVAS